MGANLSTTQEAVGSYSVLYPLEKLNAQELADLKAQLRQLPASSTPIFPYGERRQLVSDLLEEILFLREQGYSYSEISDLLNEKTNVLIQPKTLRRYFFEEQAKQRGTAARTQRSRPKQHRNCSAGRKPFNQQVPPPIAEECDSSAVSNQPDPPVKPAVTTAKRDQKSSRSSQADKTSSRSSQADKKSGWGDGNPPAGGLLNEPKFNVIERD